MTGLGGHGEMKRSLPSIDRAPRARTAARSQVVAAGEQALDAELQPTHHRRDRVCELAGVELQPSQQLHAGGLEQGLARARQSARRGHAMDAVDGGERVEREPVQVVLAQQSPRLGVELRDRGRERGAKGRAVAGADLLELGVRGHRGVVEQAVRELECVGSTRARAAFVLDRAQHRDAGPCAQ